jgi:hypothetical protein
MHPLAPKNKNRPRGRPSITKTERPRSANLLQMPRGQMCKLRQRGRDYGGRAGSRGIDPSLQPLPFAAIAGAALYRRSASDNQKFKPQFRPRLSDLQHWCCVLCAGLYCICEWPLSVSTRLFITCQCSKDIDRRCSHFQKSALALA